MKKHDYQISPHVYDSATPTEVKPEAPQLPWRSQAFHISNGDILIGGIDGYDFQEGGHGHPRLTIAEAREFRAEMLKRWNLHNELVKSLRNMVSVGCEFCDMDMGENGSAAVDQANATLAKAEGAL